MGGELVGGSSSTKGADTLTSAPFSYTETFDRLCPEYMAMGMTYDEFWNQDVLIVKYYRKAHTIKREKENFDMWLQGKYFYDALCCVSPILRAFSSATEPIPFLEKPYALTQEEAEIRKESEEERKMRETKEVITSMMIAVNKRRREKGETDGSKS